MSSRERQHRELHLPPAQIDRQPAMRLLPIYRTNRLVVAISHVAMRNCTEFEVIIRAPELGPCENKPGVLDTNKPGKPNSGDLDTRSSLVATGLRMRGGSQFVNFLGFPCLLCCGWCRGIRQSGPGTAPGPVLTPLGCVGLGGGLLASWRMKTPPAGREKALLPVPNDLRSVFLGVFL